MAGEPQLTSDNANGGPGNPQQISDTAHTVGTLEQIRNRCRCRPLAEDLDADHLRDPGGSGARRAQIPR
jgi:hypothetical protein